MSRFVRNEIFPTVNYGGKHAFTISQMNDLDSYFSAIDSPRVMNGSTVNTWNNLGSNPNDATQATAGDQPLYDAVGMNGAPTLTFDGAGDFLQVDSVLALEGVWDIFSVVESTDVSSSTRWYAGRTTASNADALSLGHPGGGDPRTTYNDGTATFTDLSFVDDTPTIIRANFDGSTLRCYQDGVLSSTTLAESGSVSDINRAIGGLWQENISDTIGFFWTGNISELAFFSKIKTDAENNAILSSLGNIYGITVTLL